MKTVNRLKKWPKPLTRDVEPVNTTPEDAPELGNDDVRDDVNSGRSTTKKKKAKGE